MPALEALATETPEYRVNQSDTKDFIASLVHRKAPRLEYLLPIFEHTQIEERAIARPLEWYAKSPGWNQRAETYEEVGLRLAHSVVTKCLNEAGVSVAAIDGIVFVNNTGLATPSLEAHLVNRMDFPPSIIRLPIWGLGCAGGVAGLSRAADLIEAGPNSNILLISLELCSLAYLQTKLSKKMIVASSLFADGAAAALVSGDEDGGGIRLVKSSSHLFSNTLDVMGWDVVEEGLDVVFSTEVPSVVENHVGKVVRDLLNTENIALDDTRCTFHPGGPKVLRAYKKALDLDTSALEASKEVLRKNGNMSGPTVLFVLQESLARAKLDPAEPALLAAVGPGFAAELCLIVGT